jgi:hypothetical protein
MTILLFDRKATDPAVPTWAMPGQRAQERSSKAAGLRTSGSCLTEPSTLAFSFLSGARPEPLSATSAVCPIYWWQNKHDNFRLPFAREILLGKGRRLSVCSA